MSNHSWDPDSHSRSSKCPQTCQRPSLSPPAARQLKTRQAESVCVCFIYKKQQQQEEEERSVPHTAGRVPASTWRPHNELNKEQRGQQKVNKSFRFHVQKRLRVKNEHHLVWVRNGFSVTLVEAVRRGALVSSLYRLAVLIVWKRLKVNDVTWKVPTDTCRLSVWVLF